MHPGISVGSREKFQSHPALALLEILLDSSFQLFSIFLKKPHAGTCIVSHLDLLLAGLLSLQSAPSSALTSSSQLMDQKAESNKNTAG